MKRLLYIALSAACSSEALAMESAFYIENQMPDKAYMDVAYSFVDSNYSSQNLATSSVSNGIDFSLRENLRDQQSIWATTSLTNRRVDWGSQEASAVGLSDIAFGYKRGRTFALLTATYGLAGSLSPGVAMDPRLGQVSQINNFSGVQSIGPFAGFESYYGNTAMGAEFKIDAYSDIHYEDRGSAQVQNNPNRFVPKLKGFVEVPLSHAWDWGAEFEVGRNTFAVDQMLLGGPGNEYAARTYASWKFNPRNAFVGALSAADEKYPLPVSGIGVSLALHEEM